MRPEIKRAIAYIALCISNNRQYRSIFDFGDAKNVIFTGTISDSNINIYDHSLGCFINGNSRQLYHFGYACHISFSVTGSTFRGFEFSSANHFSGNISGNRCSLYDYGTAGYTNYRCV